MDGSASASYYKGLRASASSSSIVSLASASTEVGSIISSATTATAGGSVISSATTSSAGAIMCVDCREETSVTDSSATGRNPLVRRCNPCGSFQRGLSRACSSSEKGGRVPDEVSKKDALKVKALLKTMEKEDPVARVEYFRAEKRKRELEQQQTGEKTKRTFLEPKAQIRQETANKNLEDETDNYEPFEDYAIRQIALKRCDDEPGALKLWVAALAKPGAMVIQRRGEWCLGRFAGVSYNKRHETGTTSAVNQSREIADEADLAKFFEQSEATQARNVRKSSSLHECTRSTSELPKVSGSSIDNILTTDECRTKAQSHAAHVFRALEEKRELDLRENEMMKNAAIAAEDAAGASAAKRRKVDPDAPKADGEAVSGQPAVELNKVVEKLSAETTVDKACLAMKDTIKRQLHQVEHAKDASLKLVEQHSECDDKAIESKTKLKDQVAEKYAAAKKAEAPCHQEIEHLRLSWATQVADDSKTALELRDMNNRVGIVLKEFLTSGSNKLADLKKEVKVILNLQADIKKVIEKHVKETVKRKMQTGSQTVTDDVVISKLEKELKLKLNEHVVIEMNFCNVKWSLKTDLIDADVASAVAVSKDFSAILAKKISDLEYFAKQKSWAAEQMASSKCVRSNTTIVNPRALTICKTQMQALVGKDIDLKEMMYQAVVAKVGESVEPKFYQSSAGSCSKFLSTDYGLVDVRLQLQGTEYVFGIRRDQIAGDTMAAKLKNMGDLGADDFLHRIKEHGFAIKMEANQGCLIPGEPYMLVMVSPDDASSHGVRMLVPGGKKRSAETKAYFDKCQAEFPAAAGGSHEMIKDFAQRIIDQD